MLDVTLNVCFIATVEEDWPSVHLCQEMVRIS